MKTFNYTQEIEIGDDIIERELKIEYTYQPGEAPSRDREYPGYPAGIDEMYICDADGNEVSDQLTSEELQRIEDLCIQDMESKKPEPDFDW